MSENIEKAPNVPPFVTFVTSTVPMVFDNSLSYYEALCALWKWLQDDVVNVINNNATVTEDYIQLTNEMKEYMDNYFDNLDVQEEINNKLDQMAEDGTLQEIITDYIQANVAWTFDTVADMKLSTNLVNGSYARTLGYRTINDGGGALYKITNSGTADEMSVIAVDTLYAHLVYNGEVKPEQLGCYNDQIHDDAIYIQEAIDLSKEFGVKVNFAHNEYYVLTGINIPEEFSIDFQGITLKAMVATAFTKGMLNIETTLNIHNGVISNLKFDQNNTAPKAIYIDRSWRRTYENIDIKNTPSGGYGIYLDGTNGSAGGNQFNNITGSGNYRNSTFIYVGVNDCVFSHVDYQQYTIGIHTNRFVRLFDIHGYVATDVVFPDDWYTGSIFIKMDDGASILADDLYPDTHNYCFYNASVLPSVIGKVFFTFNENTIQGEDNPSVMFKALNDNVLLFYRWRVDTIDLGISDNIDFELVKNASSEYLSTFIHINHITGSAEINIEVPPCYVERILPQNNFTKLGIYGSNLIATGTCQYTVGSVDRDICKLRSTSGYRLIDGLYPFKAINPSDGTTILNGTVKVENNIVTIKGGTGQGAGFPFYISIPVVEYSAVSGSY